MKSLRELKQGEKAYIKYIDTEYKSKLRLRELGIVEGAEVMLECTSIFNDPCAYRVWGSVIAVRNRIAEKIFIGDNA